MSTTEKPEQVARAPLSRVLQNSTLYLSGNVASRALGFIAIPFYSHFLSPAEYGTIELIEISTQVVAISFGLQTIGTALIRLFHDQDTVKQETDVVSTTVIATALLSGVIVTMAVLLATPISLAVFHSTEHAGLLRAAFVAMWFSSIVEIILVYQRIRERAKFFFCYSMISLAGSLGLNIYFIGFVGAGVWGFIYSKLVVTGIGTAFLLCTTLREVGWHWQRGYIPKLVHFGLPLCFASMCIFAIHFSDRFFLVDAVSLSELGKYALAYKFAFLASILVSDSFGKSWNTTFYRFARQDGWRERFARVAQYLFFALYLTALAVSLTAPELLSLMVPPSFYPPFLLLPILVLSYVFRDCGDFFRNLMLINKRSNTVATTVSAAALLNFALNFALIPSFGIYGAALATMGTWLAYMVVFWLITWNEHHIPIRIMSFAKITIFAVGIFTMANNCRIEYRYIQLLIDGVWIAAFATLSFAFYFSASDRADIVASVMAQVRRLSRHKLQSGTPPHSEG